MRRIIVAITWLCLSGYPLMGQHLSPLFGVLASQSPLQRPELFQQLQDELPDYLKDIEPGLRMPFINDQLKEFEAKLSNAINGITAIVSGNNLQIIDSNSKEIIIELTSTGITINKIGLKTSISNSGLKTLLWRIVSHIDDPILKQYASVIRDAPSESIDRLLTGSPITLTSNTTIFMDASSMAEYINTQLKNFSEKVIQAMHIAENEYAEIVAQASDYFINGDIGLSLTSGEGAFAGGVFIGIKKQGFSLGGFTNLIGSSIDKDKSPGNAQIGLRTTIPTHANGSIDFFCSSYMSSSDTLKHDFYSLEFGLGYSIRLKESLLLGLAGTCLKIDGNKYRAVNVGFLLNGVSQYLPTLVVGLGYQKKTNGYLLYPIFQIIQPLNAL